MENCVRITITFGPLFILYVLNVSRISVLATGLKPGLTFSSYSKLKWFKTRTAGEKKLTACLKYCPMKCVKTQNSFGI